MLRISGRRAAGGDRTLQAALLGLLLLLPGCDPVLNVEGAFFPAWILCLLGGLALTGVVHRVFLALDLQQDLGPLVLVYPSLAVLLTMTLWLLFFRT